MGDAPMQIDIKAFRAGSSGLAELGRDAGLSVTQGVQDNLGPLSATSPVGNQISMLTGLLEFGMLPAGPGLTTTSTDLHSTTETGLSNIENQDAANAEGLPEGARPGVPGLAGSDTPGELDPAALEEEAKKAEEALGGDQMSQLMMQMLQMGVQTGAQMAQQLSQQLSQITSKLGELVGQVGQQASQLASKVAESAAEASSEAPELEGLDDIAAAAQDGSAGGPGGSDIGSTMPAGLDGPVTAMTTSAALQPSPLQPAGSATTGTSNMASRMPMMPMMPMHGMHGNRDNGGATTTRDPIIYPEDTLFDPPQGVEQTFGANPEIEVEEPPFGEAEGS